MFMKKSVVRFLLVVAMCSGSIASAVEVIVLHPLVDMTTFNGIGRDGVTIPGNQAGNADISYTRLYERFLLPAYVDGTTISRATFDVATSSITNTNRALQIFATNNHWKPEAVANNGARPVPTGNVLGQVAQGFNLHQSIDLTDFVNAAYQHGDGMVSFVVMSYQEDRAWKDSINFLSGKTLNISITSAVPEPSTYLMLLLGLAFIGGTAYKRRMR